MTSEEIIQRLLDEKKITVKEAMIILKDLAKIGLQEVKKKFIPKYPYIPTNPPYTDPINPNTITVMYGVGTSPYIWSDSENNAVSTKSLNTDFNNEEGVNNIKE